MIFWQSFSKSIREKLKIEKDGAVLFLVEGNEVKLKGVSGVRSEQLAWSLKKLKAVCEIL